MKETEEQIMLFSKCTNSFQCKRANQNCRLNCRGITKLQKKRMKITLYMVLVVGDLKLQAKESFFCKFYMFF